MTESRDFAAVDPVWELVNAFHFAGHAAGNDGKRERANRLGLASHAVYKLQHSDEPASLRLMADLRVMLSDGMSPEVILAWLVDNELLPGEES